MSKTFVIGDIHGNHKGLVQCLERSNFDYENDKLIQLGDICDGWHEVRECFEELLKIKNRIDILGNHDDWARDYYDGYIIFGDIYYKNWVSQGGHNTLKSYDHTLPPDSHRQLLREAKLYHIEDNKLFVHAGFNPNKKMEDQKKDTLIWDRNLFRIARSKHYTGRSHVKYGDFDDVFIGHTTTQYITGETDPLHFCNIHMLDTGGGWNGKITIMDIKTKEYWQSDASKDLYPGMIGRG